MNRFGPISGWIAASSADDTSKDHLFGDSFCLVHAMIVRWFAVALVLCLLAGCRSNSRVPLETVDDAPAAHAPAPTPAEPVKPVAPAATPAVQPASYQPEALTPPANPRDLSLRTLDDSPSDRPPHQPEVVEPHDQGRPVRPVVDCLTLADLEQMALVNNPSLGEAQARVAAARGNWLQVGLMPNTVLGYSGQQLFSGGEAEQQGLYIEQEFVRGQKLQLNRAVASQEIRRAEQQWAAQQLRVLTDVRLTYYRILVAQQRVAVNERLVEIADNALETAEALLRAKEVSQLDVTRARIEQQTARLQYRNALAQLEAGWRRLEAVTSTHDLPRCRLLGDLQNFDHHLSADAVLNRIQAENPMLASAVTNVSRARWAIQRAVAEPIPNVDVAAVVQSDNGTDSANANLQITIPIPWLDRNQGNIARARSELVEAQRNVDRLRQYYAWQLADVFQRYAVARNRVDEYRREEGILDQAQKALDQVSRAYRAGELPYLDLLNAQRIYSENSLSYIEALGELWESLVEMDGLLLKDSLESLEMDAIQIEP